MQLYLLPIERIGAARGPRYLQWRYADGLDLRWSLKDFGQTSEIALAAVDGFLRAPDVLQMPVTWSQIDRDRVGGFLRSAGLESTWVEQAADWREAWQRLAGLTQVYQSAVDDPNTSARFQDPSAWLGRFVHFGIGTLQPLDMQAFAREREAKRWRIGDWVQYGRVWINQVTGKRVPVIAGGALPASDAFTTASDQALATYSANWSLNTGAIQVLAASDDFHANSATAEVGGFHNVETYNNDQYAQIVMSAVSDAGFAGAAVRCGGAGVASYYGFYTADTSDYLFKMVTGTFTQLGSTGGGSAVSDTIRIEASGTAISPKRNGSVPGTPGTQTDSSLTSGKAGICGWGNSNLCRGDNFEGANLAWDGYAAIESGASTNGTTLSGGVALNMPSGIVAGNLLIAIASNDNTGGTAMGISGWTNLFNTTFANTANTISHGVWAKIAAGSDTATLTGAAQDYAARVLRISNHGVTSIASDIKVGTPAQNTSATTSTTPNPPSLDAGSSKKWLWIATNGSDDDDNSATYAPTNYTAESQVESAQSTSSTMIQVAYRKYEIQTEDPGTFTLAAVEEWIANVIAIPPTSTGTAVGQTTETDTAQAIAKRKTKAVGQSTETDTAQAIAEVKARALGQNTEADTAQAISKRKVRAVGQVVETDTAQAITRFSSTITVAVGQVVETDTAQAIAKRKVRAVGQVVETDTAQAIAKRKVKALGQVVETDTAQAIAKRKVKALGQSTETDTAQAIAKRKVRAVGQVVETDTAQAISTVAGIAVGQVVETDTAQAMRAVKIVFVQQVSEGDLAQSLFPLKYVAVVQVVETDLAQAITVNAGASVILIAPSGAYEVWVNSFEWTGIPNATWYLLQVRTLDDVDLFLQWYLIVDVGQGVGDLDCAVSPAALANLPLGSYKWRILPYTTDYLVWTDYKYFSVINPIVYVAMGQAFETDKAFAMRYEYSHKVGLKIPERRRSTLSDGEPLEGMAPKRKPRRLYK